LVRAAAVTAAAPASRIPAIAADSATISPNPGTDFTPENGPYRGAEDPRHPPPRFGYRLRRRPDDP
jgi:hypothetical protein